MSTTAVTVRIEASVEEVFDVVAHIENFKKAVPHVVQIEYLSTIHRGVGTRFRETRIVGGRRAVTELEVTEYVENDHVRLVSNSGGALWDSIFTLRQAGGVTTLKLVMESTPRTARARLLNPLIRRVLRRALQTDLDAIKAYIEARP